MKNINKHIKENNFNQVYLLFGEENYLKNAYKNKLKKAIISDGDTMNCNYFYGSNTNYNEIIDIAETMPFFADRRLLIIEDSLFFKTSKDEIVNYMNSIPPTTYFIFVENEVDKRSRMYKKVKDIGYQCELNRQPPKELSNWILSIISAENKKISFDTMSLFLSKTGSDMENISKELEKLICYTYNKEIISIQDVEAICTTEITGKIFEMIDAMGMKNKDKLFNLYQDLISVKEPPMKIIFLIERQFNLMLQIKDLDDNGNSKNIISEKIKLSSYIVNKTLSQAGNFSKRVLKNAIEDMMEMEEMVKTGRLNDKIAVELFLIKYTK